MSAMKLLLAASLVAGIQAGSHLNTETASCAARDAASMALLQEKLEGPDCEGMCRRLGKYPDCQCPGFNGQPASSDDTRACYTSYCQDPSTPCPNDAFTNCVGSSTKVLLQWDAVNAKVDARLNMLMQAVRANKAKSAESCTKTDTGALALLNLKATNMGEDCEEMCKRIGSYPDCACPGFAGQPASSDDTRACYTKYCQDPRQPCPNDGFNTCVDESTKVSALQWKAVMSHASKQLDGMMQVVRKHKATLKVADGPHKLPEQGYEGKEVRHQNMKSITSDWGGEYGPVKKVFHSGASSSAAAAAVAIAVIALM